MIRYGRFFMKQILKVVFVIIGTIIGAGFASRTRNLSIFWKISILWTARDTNIFNYYGDNNI